MEIVRRILDDVKEKGDSAVLAYSKKFDGAFEKDFEITEGQVKAAFHQADPAALKALKTAALNITRFSKLQAAQLKSFSVTKKGCTIGQKVIPLARVGCYVPGGRYPLPSSALMSIIPAKAAGVREIIACSPNINPVTIAAASLAGATRIFSIGGAQAIGAMAYGTKTVPKVDKIVGPGNRFVAAAKKEVYGVVGIDFIAGPTELLIIADSTANPGLIAADLLAQAEHDSEARVFLATDSRKLADEVNLELERQLRSLATNPVAGASLRHGNIVIVNNLHQAASLANEIAPEHVELQVKNPDDISPALRNYGSLFIGMSAAEVFGDYCAGINHILPTGGSSRYTGGLSVRDFVKIVTFMDCQEKATREMVDTAITLARIEGLEGHRKAAELRGRR
ncbi:histidinol dehydrogenase [Candidatus Woesearchaeota archaeon]|nr:histidinol dehydrogenase [Candidatus Woesearchaeota archaeon]